MFHNTEKIRQVYKSKNNLTRKNQVILLMITDGDKWHYLAVKSLSALFRGIASNNNGDFYCLNCFQSYNHILLTISLKSINNYVRIMIAM